MTLHTEIMDGQYQKQIVAKDGDTLYSQQKQNLELTMAQIGNYYCKIQA